jgi:hypothetical protein
MLNTLHWSLPIVQNLRVFGSLGRNVPSFAHAYSFTIFLIAALGFRVSNVVGASVGWFAIESLFEIGQHPAVCQKFVEAMAGWNVHNRLLQFVLCYFSAGVFDPWDLSAIAAGVGLGVATVVIYKQGVSACRRKKPG